MRERTKERTIERKERTNVYQMVTDRIIAELEKGRIPWEKPWTSGNPNGAFNRITKKPYSLLNQILLGRDGEWMSFKQVQELGGHVKRGEHASFVVFWKMQEVSETNEDGEIEIKHIPLLRYYNVFHISQTEGIEPLHKEELKDVEPIDSAEKLLNNYIDREGIILESSISNRAYYSPSTDSIHLPMIGQFERTEEYYSTALHEATHSTMKESRCNREQERKGKLVAFGSEEYSKEELVGELGSASIMNRLGLEPVHSFRNSTAYIQSWIKALQNDTKMIVSAGSRAEKAVEYILNGKQ